MHPYDHFARFYDALMNDPLANVARVLGYRERHMPRADSLLELGCGSGSILAGLHQLDRLVGLDRSPQMLAAARAKVPRARFVEANMTTFELDQRFDIVICVFDTLNHLVTVDAWRALFECARAHLRAGGLFVFDVNTVGQLRRLGDTPPWVSEVDGATITQDVEWLGDGHAIWHVRIRERLDDGRYALHHELIGELGIELPAIAGALAADFELLESSDDDALTPTDESARAYFAYRARR
jgi:SAM-dependent methyltransferase